MAQCKDCGKQISRGAKRCRSCAAKKRCEDPKVRARFSKQMAETSKRLWQDPEFRTMRSEKAKQQWEGPEFRARRSELWEDPEFRARISESASTQMKQQWQDPEYKAKMSEKMRRQWEDPEFRVIVSEQMSETSRRLWEDPEYRAIKSEQTSEWSRQQWQDPEYRALISEQASEQMKRQWEDPEYNVGRMLGENNPNWQGGISFEPYGLEWTEKLRKAIRKRDNYTCAICDEWGNHVHHINYDKTNNRYENLITLCHGCHAKTNRNRECWPTPLAYIAEGRTNAFMRDFSKP